MDIKEIFEKNYVDLNALCDSIVEGVVIANPSRSFLYWNKSAKLILENEPDNEDPSNWAFKYRLFDPLTEDYLSFEKLPMIMALNGEEFSDYRIMTKTITHPEGVILSVNGKPLRSGNATIGAITTFRDITKQISQERANENEKRFYERILDLIPGIVFIKDLSGKFIYGNKNFHELLGTESVIGKTSDTYLVKTMADKVYAHDKEVLTSGHAQDFEEIIHWNDGSKSIFRTTRFPYVQDNGEVKGVCAVAKDITKELQASAALEEERNRLTQVSKLAAIGVLSAEIAHEIKNPLTIIQMANDVLQSEINEQDMNKDLVREKIKVINEAIDRMNKVVCSLGTVSRNGDSDGHTSYVIGEMLEEVVSLCSSKTQKLKINIDIKKSEVLASKMTANRVQISEVLLNVIMNALDAVENEIRPEVTVGVFKEQNYYIFKVWDNGPGVPEDIRMKIFEPFYTTKKLHHGTGLGLSIAKKIVEKHNGDLSYEDTRDGHCFVIRIPTRMSHSKTDECGLKNNEGLQHI